MTEHLATATPLKLIVIARDEVPHVKRAWNELESVLRDRPGIDIVAVDREGALLDYPADADLVVVFGGDGAILRACRQMDRHQLPMLGVNLGRLGFLADLLPDEFLERIPQIEQRKYRIVEHLMYECTLLRANGSRESHLGLNEVVIAAGGSLQLIDIELAINDEAVTTYSGDGLIISTPVGSTAHSLSAGGPILRQELQAFVITPICPHTLTIRPVVDSADCVYCLRVPNVPPGVTLVVDGQVQRPLQAGDRVEIRRAPVSFKLVKVPGHSYYGMLHRKLGWTGQPQYRRP